MRAPKLVILSLLLCLLRPTGATVSLDQAPTDLVLGRPADTSIAVSALPSADLEAYYEYGLSQGTYIFQTVADYHTAGSPFIETLSGLMPGTRYFYRVRYRLPGSSTFDAGEEHSFQTMRPRGVPFVFTLQADPHLGDPNTNEGLYTVELANAAADSPDFHLDLGDTFMTEKYGGTCADAAEDCAGHMPFFGIVGASAPIFLVNGNHEGELGWLNDDTASCLAVCSTDARRSYYPCPEPGGFYSGASEPEPFVGVRDGYYSWEWGDALFVVLDPYWYTAKKPKPTGDGWDWTLGYDQYSWLKRTLEQSSARFKFVFLHNLVGGADSEARGGAEAARFGEWGGDNYDGSYGFDANRQGWGEPVHELLVRSRVSAVFHGHDHIFVKQELDGVVYQECPRPSLANYTDTGNASKYGYLQGDVVANSGHIRVSVTPSLARVEYVRAYLPGDGPNGQVAFSYSINGAAVPGDCDGDATVGIAEVQRAINMFLGLQPAACGADCDGNGQVSIGELQKVINAFLGLQGTC